MNKYIKTNEIIRWSLAEAARRASSVGTPPPEMDNGEGREEPQTPRTLYFNCSQSDIPLGLTYSMDTTGYKYDVYSLLKLTHAL